MIKVAIDQLCTCGLIRMEKHLVIHSSHLELSGELLKIFLNNTLGVCELYLNFCVEEMDNKQHLVPSFKLNLISRIYKGIIFWGFFYK